MAQAIGDAACSMTVKAIMSVRLINLVVPLAHEATAMRITDTAGRVPGWSGAVSPLIGYRPSAGRRG